MATSSAPQPSPDLIASPLALYLPPTGSDPVIIVCLRETHTRPVTFTSHPVEQGAPVTDHARPEAQQVTLECLASKTPIADGYTGADELWQQLEALMSKPALIDAITIGSWYTNMGVDNLTRPIDVNSANAVRFTMSLKGIRIVKNKLTRVVRSAVPKAQRKKKAGAVMTFTLDEADDRGALEKIVDAFR